MAGKKSTDGVGKKIVEALKKQSEIDIIPVVENKVQEDELITENTEIQDIFQEGDFLDNLPSDDDLDKITASESTIFEESPVKLEETSKPPLNKQFGNYQQPAFNTSDNFIKELDTFEIPSNISVLKKLIAQLPSGVTRHTGAQIIKQTMEALGISMKSVLQEAQQVQEGLNSSAKECHNTIQEYKKQITLLEKQAQNNQRQYAALNELISLFIQTGI